MADQEMVERVGSAIESVRLMYEELTARTIRSEGWYELWNAGKLVGRFDEPIAGYKAEGMERARAAITAMREPTEQMLCAAQQPLPEEIISDGRDITGRGPFTISLGHPAPRWRAMIDAALGEDDG